MVMFLLEMLILLTCTYLATINLKYTSYNNHEEAGIRFTGVHVSR